MQDIPQSERRFGGIQRLYGDDSLVLCRRAHIGVIGIGGVGSWSAEALARSGIGRISLFDLDHVAESNINRQIHATEATLGQAKVLAMRERIQSINPECRVDVVEDFVTRENLQELLAEDFDYLIDATDAAAVKAALIAHCKRRGLPLTVCGAAGGKGDATAVRISDLTRTEQDPLLAKVRGILRRHYDFTRNPKKTFGVKAVWSAEAVKRPQNSGQCETGQGPTGLNCAGYGSVVWVTAAFGFAAAGQAMEHIISTKTVGN